LKVLQLLDLKRNKYKNLLLSFFAFIVILTPLYNKITENYINNSLKQATISYAITRSINAAVSVIKHSSISIGVGIDGTIALGEALDPIDDATERFSDLLTLSIWTLGSEKVLYEISKFNIFTIIIIVLALINIFYPKKLLQNLLIILIVFKIFIPFDALVSYFFNKYYFNPQIEQNINNLKPLTKNNSLQNLNITDNTFISKIKYVFNKTTNSLEEIQHLATFYISNTQKIIESFINLAAIYITQFLLNVILLPLFLIYLIKNLKLE